MHHFLQYFILSQHSRCIPRIHNVWLKKTSTHIQFYDLKHHMHTFTSPQLLRCGPFESLRNMHPPQHAHCILVVIGLVLSYNQIIIVACMQVHTCAHTHIYCDRLMHTHTHKCWNDYSNILLFGWNDIILFVNTCTLFKSKVKSDG